MAERLGNVPPDLRKTILVCAFGESLKTLGNYEYVAETTRPSPAEGPTAVLPILRDATPERN
jgi:hypothetical protein